ncbi:hypothetical protein E2C01_047178 [Portunus trituberculatus]|uniref:Uncharacterized protein n=1 Tax=Portunus trituberculatus TaxID=210409 RepID=A0A5B7G6R3_PORTR|nr:hypothetical protein [Portunus trituberculatus]
MDQVWDNVLSRRHQPPTVTSDSCGQSLARPRPAGTWLLAPSDPESRASVSSGRAPLLAPLSSPRAYKRSLPNALAEGLHRRWSRVAADHRRLPPALRQKIFTPDAAGDLTDR